MAQMVHEMVMDNMLPGRAAQQAASGGSAMIDSRYSMHIYVYINLRSTANRVVVCYVCSSFFLRADGLLAN